MTHPKFAPAPTLAWAALDPACWCLRPVSALFAETGQESGVSFLCFTPQGRLVAPVWTSVPGNRSGVLGFFDGDNPQEAQVLHREWFDYIWAKPLNLGEVHLATEQELPVLVGDHLNIPGTMMSWLDNLDSVRHQYLDRYGQPPNCSSVWNRDAIAAHAAHLLFTRKTLPLVESGPLCDTALLRKCTTSGVLGQQVLAALLAQICETLPEGLLDLARQLSCPVPVERDKHFSVLLKRLPPEDLACWQKVIDDGFRTRFDVETATEHFDIRRSNDAHGSPLRLPPRYPLANMLADLFTAPADGFVSFVDSYAALA